MWGHNLRFYADLTKVPLDYVTPKTHSYPELQHLFLTLRKYHQTMLQAYMDENRTYIYAQLQYETNHLALLVMKKSTQYYNCIYKFWVLANSCLLFQAMSLSTHLRFFFFNFGNTQHSCVWIIEHNGTFKFSQSLGLKKKSCVFQVNQSCLVFQYRLNFLKDF